MPFTSSTNYGSSSLFAAVSSSTALLTALVNSTFKQVSFYLAEPSIYCYTLTPESGNDDIVDGEITAGQLTGLFMAMAKEEVEFEVVGFGGIEFATPEEFIIKRSGAGSSEEMTFHPSPLVVAQQPTLIRSPSIHSIHPIIISKIESTVASSTPSYTTLVDTVSRSYSPSLYSQEGEVSFDSIATSSSFTTIAPSIFSQSSSESTTPSTITPMPSRDTFDCSFFTPTPTFSTPATASATKEKKRKNALVRGMRKVGKAIKKGVKKTLAAF